MWDYSEKVKEHFFSPRNAGAVTDANGVGDVGSLSCGDALRLSLKVDEASDTIVDAGFQTFGCGSAIASSSALTEIIKGKTLDEALAVSNQDIADYLDGLPPEKMHCSVMGREALQAAVANYRGEVWRDDHEEGALVCKCFAIDEVMISDTVKNNGLTTVEEVINYTKAGGACASCHEGIEDILIKLLAEQGQVFNAGGSRIAGSDENLKQHPVLSGYARMKRIEQLLEDIRPELQRDKGDVELIDVKDDVIFVKMTGACAGCQMAVSTLMGIQQHVSKGLNETVRVYPQEEMHNIFAEA